MGKRNTASSGLTMDSFIHKIYMPYAKVRKRSWSLDARVVLKYISPNFGAQALAEIKHSEVEKWFCELRAKKLAFVTCNRILSVMKAIFSVACTHGLIPNSPCTGIRPYKVSLQRERHLTRNEARALMAELKQSPRREATIIILLLLTGARKSEILKAKWENYNREMQLLDVPISKSGRVRHIALSDEACEIIDALPRTKGGAWLFPGREGNGPISDIYIFWNQIRKKLGLGDLRIHDLRHSFASFLVNSGHSLYEVQKLLGHADPRTTMRYAHLGNNVMRDAVQLITSIMTSVDVGAHSHNAQCPFHDLLKKLQKMRIEEPEKLEALSRQLQQNLE